MKAAILAGGYGKRLKPITDSLPKPMIDIAGKPIIGWQVHWLRSFGIKSFVFLVGYKKEKLVDYFDRCKAELGIEVEYSVEEKPLGTGGALLQAKRLLQEGNFLLLNGDVVTNIDVSQMKLDSGLVTMALVPLRSPFGIVKLNDGKITDFEEKPLLKEHLVNAGVYLMNRRIFEYLPAEGDIEKTTFVKLASMGQLNGVSFCDAYWKSIDSIKDMEEATNDLKQNKNAVKGPTECQPM